MNKELKYAFIIHICKYLGIALVAGSVVHAGSLGGSTYKYIAFIMVGMLLTVLGNYLEYKVKNIKIGFNIFALAILLSFGTGMLSGGVQHYADNPSYGSILLSFGLILTFVSLGYKDFKDFISKKSVLIVGLISIVLYFVLSTVGASLVSDLTSHGHGKVETLPSKMSDMKNMHQMPNGEMMDNGGKMMADHNNMGGTNMMDMTMNDMSKMMEGKTGVALEKEFIAGMIPHHQGAVDMANKLLQDKTISPEIKKFAEDIIKAQEGEIKIMNEWMEKKYK